MRFTSNLLSPRIILMYLFLILVVNYLWIVRSLDATATASSRRIDDVNEEKAHQVPVPSDTAGIEMHQYFGGGHPFPSDVLPDHQVYEHPLVQRYATKEMSLVWSPAVKFTTWRKLWIALATAEQELGIDISDEQLKQMRDSLYDIDFDYAAEKEREFRHDVMGHVHAYGKVAPKAMPIIHLGATSCYVTDNTELIQIKDALLLIKRKLLKAIHVLKKFAVEHRDLPTLGFTHYQPAQLTTVGKRCTLWMQDLLLDLKKIDQEISDLPMRGVKGTTGTQASFLELFDGDHENVKALNKRVTELMGFDRVIPVSGQTYTRKIDFNILSALSGIAQSAYKMSGDIRLLSNLKEVEEPFSKTQVGSSAMAYKRNPMRSERVCSLARYVMGLPNSAANTAANQWFERTLDDSAIRRIYLPEGFLAVDVILNLLTNIADGLHVWPNVIKARVASELPFMATEVILMECVKRGGDRQQLHEAIRVHSMKAGAVVKGEGKPNDLMARIAADPLFQAIHDDLDRLVDPMLFVGRAPEQVDEFIKEEIDPILKANEALLDIESIDVVNV
jgi:adenylosuccinate lyase